MQKKISAHAHLVAGIGFIGFTFSHPWAALRGLSL